MKKWIAALTMLGVFFSATVFAMPNDETELLLMSRMAKKKAVVLATMKLSGEKKEAFGKLYDEYQQKLAQVFGNKLKIIINYAKNYENLDSQTAKSLLDQWFTNNENAIKLQREYAKKFSKILEPAEVIRCIQIENRIRILREAEIAEMVPLAELPKTLSLGK